MYIVLDVRRQRSIRTTAFLPYLRRRFAGGQNWWLITTTSTFYARRRRVYFPACRLGHGASVAAFSYRPCLRTPGLLWRRGRAAWRDLASLGYSTAIPRADLPHASPAVWHFAHAMPWRILQPAAAFNPPAISPFASCRAARYSRAGARPVPDARAALYCRA